MSTEDRKRLHTEHDAITARLAAATGAERETLLAQFGERLSHLKARLDGPEPKAPK
ncbi:MAG: hypothetical protein QOE70_4381 [Chthoniobacter sp.]|jgi:hypothetical protein|nr:hypothetical protein [Chthoniobacter sp.]